MQEPTNPISAWESFYVIVGSSGAALTGLQFVVIALTTEVRRRRSTAQFDAFGTPTVVHFCVALLVSAILSAPWRELSSAALAIGIAGIYGLVYTAIVVRRVRRQTVYALVFEDWLFHTALPFLAYATMLSAALTLVHHTEDALFGIGSASILLLFIGIHNAWDSVTFIAANPEDVDAGETMPTEGVGIGDESQAT
ncbi:MAG TPA: hypothetical protein VGJ12_10425 [Gemmatimonadaceae bacterium]|jgi:hypothetical protein